MVRAIHIEVVHSLDTDSFINSLRRFMARRGSPERIRTDNGSNFVSGEADLRRAISNWNQDKIRNFLLQRNVEWRPTPRVAHTMEEYGNVASEVFGRC